MEDKRKIIAHNIYTLRTDASMTQLSLAEALNYTDKAVSKWERGESLPDVLVLKRIAEYFGVSVDYLLESTHGDELRSESGGKRRIMHPEIALCFLICWLAVALTALVLAAARVDFPIWLIFLYGVPLSFLVLRLCIAHLEHGAVWKITDVLIIFGGALSIYLSALFCFGVNVWQIFVIAIIVQVAYICLKRDPA